MTTIDPGDSITLSFDAQADVSQGNYCNEAWVEPGQKKTSTRLTAKIKVGSPGNDRCQSDAVALTKTVEVEPGLTVGNTPVRFTYTFTVENTGKSEVSLTQVRDLLPTGFLYLPNTTSGDLTADNPTTTMFQGRQRLTWAFSPKEEVTPGEINTLVFDVEGIFAGGHWNEGWLTFDEFADTVYTWPSAGVEIISETESTTTTAGGTTIYTVLRQIGPETFILYKWEISS